MPGAEWLLMAAFAAAELPIIGFDFARFRARTRHHLAPRSLARLVEAAASMMARRRLRWPARTSFFAATDAATAASFRYLPAPTLAHLATSATPICRRRRRPADALLPDARAIAFSPRADRFRHCQDGHESRLSSLPRAAFQHAICHADDDAATPARRFPLRRISPFIWRRTAR